MTCTILGMYGPAQFTEEDVINFIKIQNNKESEDKIEIENDDKDSLGT